jgi:hypothetical protein
VGYVPRGSLRGVFIQYHGYGFWKVPVMLKHRRVLSARSLAPLALVVSAGALVAAAPLSRRARALLGAEAAAYATMAVGSAAMATTRRGERRLLLRTATVFPAFHLGYGVGMARGALNALRAR